MKRLAAGVLAAVVSGAAFAAPDAARRAEAAAQAADLVGRMTPFERLGQLMMKAPGIDRLGVKPYHWWNEALHGIAREGLSTVFPQSIGAAASFDAPLLERVGDVVSTEARAKHNLTVSSRDMAEYYLPAFKALVTEAKVESVMSAYNAINGRPCTANRWLLTDLLRGEWGFRGHVVSDAGAVADICTGHCHVGTDAVLLAWYPGEEGGKPFVPKGVTELFVGGGQPGFADAVRTEVVL